MGVGRKVAVGAAEETAYGTPVAATEWYPVTPDASFKLVQNDLESGRLNQTRTINTLDTAIGTSHVEVDFGGAFPVQGHGVLLKHLFGKVVTGSAVDSAYTHTYTVNDPGLFIGLTFLRHFDIYQETAAGCKIKSMAFSAKVNDYLRYKVSAIGKSLTPAAVTGTPATTLVAAHPYWTFKQGAFTYAGDPHQVSACDFTVTNELFDSEDAAYSIGTASPVQLRTGIFSCEGTFKRRLLADGTSAIQSRFNQNAVAKTISEGTLVFTSTTLIGATSVYKLSMYFNDMELGIPEFSTDAGIQMETVKFKCRSDGTNSPVTLVVIDAIATPVTATGTDLTA